MGDPVDEKKDGSQKSIQSNPTTPKRIARTVAGDTNGLGYLGQRPWESASSAEATSKEGTQRREPPTHHSHELYKKRETTPDERTLKMAHSDYGPLLPSTALGGVANEHIQNMGQSTIANGGPQSIDRSASGSLEPATGYQNFFKKRRPERDRPPKPPFGDPTSPRYLANEHLQRSCWPDSIPFEPPMEYRELLERRGENGNQSPYSFHGPHTRDLNILNAVPERMNPSVNDTVGFLMDYQPPYPHPGPPFKDVQDPSSYTNSGFISHQFC